MAESGDINFYRIPPSQRKNNFSPIGIQTHKIVHHERFCDLKKFTFVPNELEVPGAETLLPVHELFGYTEMNFFHPDRKFSEDFQMPPSDIIQFLKALEKIATNDRQKAFISSVRPELFFKCVLLTKNDLKQYEKFLIDK